MRRLQKDSRYSYTPYKSGRNCWENNFCSFLINSSERCSSDKARKLLDYKTSTDLHTGIKKTYEYIKKRFCKTQ